MLKEKNKTIFFAITRARQFNFKNKFSFNSIKNKINIDIFALLSLSPHYGKRIIFDSKSKFSYLFNLLIHLIYDFNNFIKLSISIVKSKNIIISNARWSNKSKSYRDTILKALEIENHDNNSFVYFKTSSINPTNIFSIGLRKNILDELTNNFGLYISMYNRFLIDREDNRDIIGQNYEISDDEKRDLLELFSNCKVNYSPEEKLILKIVKFIYESFVKFQKKLSYKKSIFLINTNIWSINSIFCDFILNELDIKIIGCQHGAGYAEKINPYTDFEIISPFFKKFLGFFFFKYYVNPYDILSMQNSSNFYEIVYLTGPLDFDKTNTSNRIVNKIVQKLNSLSVKYRCAIRVHPKVDINNFKKNYPNISKNILIFKGVSKQEGLSGNTKLCIFDNPHSTLFWYAWSKEIKTILVLDKLKSNLSTKFLKLFNLVSLLSDKFETKKIETLITKKN